MPEFLAFRFEVEFTVQGRCGIIFYADHHQQFLVWAWEHDWSVEKTVTYWIDNVLCHPAQPLCALKRVAGRSDVV